MHGVCTKTHAYKEYSKMQFQVWVLPLLLLLTVARTQADEGTCSYTGVLMTREELKKEIREQLIALQDGNDTKTTGVCSLDDVFKVAGKIEETLTKELDKFVLSLGSIQANISDLLTRTIQPVLSRLNALHQPGKSPNHTVASCKEIYDFDPNSPSGSYWIESSDGTPIRKYCDMTRTCGGAVTGGWMQVTKLDMRNSTSQCPSGLRERVHQPKRLCGMDIDGVGCSSVNYVTDGISYDQVCGKIIAYQFGNPDSFGYSGPGIGQPRSIDGNYLDGISLTHGRSPRKHVWTFAAALDEVGTYPFDNCPCTNIHSASGATSPPSFVGNDYFCDTGSEHKYRFNYLYADDPLWDGAGCGPANTCCSLNNPPWFFKQLSSSTRDDIEMRVCGNEVRYNEDIRIEEIEIYVR